MKRIIIWIIVLVLIVVSLSYAFTAFRSSNTVNNNTENEEQNGVGTLQNGEAAEYFHEQMIRGASADIGVAKEGYDDILLRKAYPGLVSSDFQGVQTFEGAYEVKGETVTFVRQAEAGGSTAERTISVQGYDTLLKNITQRLNISIDNKKDILEVINFLNTSEQIKVSLNQKGEFLGVKITPTKVLEDSRCPVDVTCIQAGTVRVEAVLESGSGSATQVFMMHEPVTTEAETITLVNVDPVKDTRVLFTDVDYVFHFEIKRR